MLQSCLNDMYEHIHFFFIRIVSNVAQARYLRRVDPITNRGYYSELEREAFTIRWFFKRAICRPFYMLFREMIVFLIVLYLLMVFGFFYARELPKVSFLTFSIINRSSLDQSSKYSHTFSSRGTTSPTHKTDWLSLALESA